MMWLQRIELTQLCGSTTAGTTTHRGVKGAGSYAIILSMVRNKCPAKWPA